MLIKLTPILNLVDEFRPPQIRDPFRQILHIYHKDFASVAFVENWLQLLLNTGHCINRSVIPNRGAAAHKCALRRF